MINTRFLLNSQCSSFYPNEHGQKLQIHIKVLFVQTKLVFVLNFFFSLLICFSTSIYLPFRWISIASLNCRAVFGLGSFVIKVVCAIQLVLAFVQRARASLVTSNILTMHSELHWQANKHSKQILFLSVLVNIGCWALALGRLASHRVSHCGMPNICGDLFLVIIVSWSVGERP